MQTLNKYLGPQLCANKNVLGLSIKSRAPNRENWTNILSLPQSFMSHSKFGLPENGPFSTLDLALGPQPKQKYMLKLQVPEDLGRLIAASQIALNNL